jgi:hypothetical protein
MALTRPQAGILGNTQITTQSVSINVAVPIIENSQIISSSYSITTGSNASSAGPITIASGVVITVPTGSVWKII